MSLVSIGIGEYASSSDTGETLYTSSLGSCIAICFYDTHLTLAGLSHIQLPDSIINPRHNPKKPACFADKAIPLMVDDFTEQGSNLDIKCYLIGGASITSKNSKTPDYFNIGAQNIEACKNILQQHNIPITREDIGGHKPRSVHFHVQNGALNIVSLNANYAL